jgi:hypothetical protein
MRLCSHAIFQTLYGLTPNTTGNGIVPEVEQIIVVDFRQWYQHGFETEITYQVKSSGINLANELHKMAVI